MIRHVFMMKFKPEVSQEQQLEFAKHMAEDMERIPGIKNPIVGTALKIEGKPAYNLALYIDFDDEAGLYAYLNDPIHKAGEAGLPTVCSEFLVLDCLY
jgi:HSP90 family molecular chaperone